MVLCPGAPEGSTGSGSDFKASQKTGHSLVSSSWESNGRRHPWFTRRKIKPNLFGFV